jgi:hypothetical protein
MGFFVLMTWYDVDLKDQGVGQLDVIFSEVPYSVRGDLYRQVSVLGIDRPLLGYDGDHISIYFANVERLTPFGRQEVRGKLEEVDVLRIDLGTMLNEISPLE